MTEASNSNFQLLRLYKRVDNELHYWETWPTDETTSMIHWGIVGEEGENRTIKSSLFRPHFSKVEKELKERIREGYIEIDIDDHVELIVEYKIEGWGNQSDSQKRFALQDKLDEIVGSTGLGFCDGGSIGSGTMEACCCVVDFNIAEKVIIRKLQGTSFGDYDQIYLEE